MSQTHTVLGDDDTMKTWTVRRRSRRKVDDEYSTDADNTVHKEITENPFSVLHHTETSFRGNRHHLVQHRTQKKWTPFSTIRFHHNSTTRTINGCNIDLTQKKWTPFSTIRFQHRSTIRTLPFVASTNNIDNTIQSTSIDGLLPSSTFFFSAQSLASWLAPTPARPPTGPHADLQGPSLNVTSIPRQRYLRRDLHRSAQPAPCAPVESLLVQSP